MTHAGLRRLSRLWSHNKALDSLKVAAAFGGIVLFCFGFDKEPWLIPLTLGVIAAALAETPDRFLGRLQALLVTLACFGLASASVLFLFERPFLFALGLAVSSFGFVMLGSLGERYATIASASIILAIYAMLGMAHADIHADHLWQEPQRLLCGALWYGCISLLAAALFGSQPARQAIAKVYIELARYLEIKARLLEPVREQNRHALRLAMATQNGRVVGAMNRARDILLRWTQTARPARGSQTYLKWYFLAQEIHERASSSHYPYEALCEAFARSDILYRCARLMQLQSAACARLGLAITEGEVFEYGEEGAQALEELGHSLGYVQSHNQQSTLLLETLADLCRNISTIELGLARAARPGERHTETDLSLRDDSPQTLNEAWLRLRQHFKPASRRFRHGLRLSAALTAGYALLSALSLPQGYWVMLTTVFVCQPNFSSTWLRLGQRLGGTLLGLLAASIFISAFPHPQAQLALIIVSGVAFFVFRAERYLLATACITILVMVCFNQFGNSYALIWPRLLDTLLGGLLAIAAVSFILPEWHGKQIHHAMARTLALSQAYLHEILAQYRTGKRDDLPYRIARRDAHNADAELSNTLASMLTEPDRYSLPPDTAYRFLCASHTLLGYISALGAHREQTPHTEASSTVQHSAQRIQTRLHSLSESLSQQRLHPGADQATHEADAPGATLHPTEQRVKRQLDLIESLLPELTELNNALAKNKNPL